MCPPPPPPPTLLCFSLRPPPFLGSLPCSCRLFHGKRRGGGRMRIFFSLPFFEPPAAPQFPTRRFAKGANKGGGNWLCAGQAKHVQSRQILRDRTCQKRRRDLLTSPPLLSHVGKIHEWMEKLEESATKTCFSFSFSFSFSFFPEKKTPSSISRSFFCYF